MYKQKYLKYKQKYLELKKIELFNGKKYLLQKPISNCDNIPSVDHINDDEYDIINLYEKKLITLQNLKEKMTTQNIKIYDCTNNLKKLPPTIKISGPVSYYYFKIYNKDKTKYKNILILGDSHTLYKKQPNHLDLIKFYKLCIVESYKNKQCLDLFMESSYVLSKPTIIKQLGGNCDLVPGNCVPTEMIVRLRNFFREGKYNMLNYDLSTKTNFSRISGTYKAYSNIDEYRQDAEKKNIKLDYIRFQDWEISQIKSWKGQMEFSKKHFVFSFSHPEPPVKKEEFNYDILQTKDLYKTNSETLKSLLSLSNNAPIKDLIKKTLKSLYIYFITDNDNIDMIDSELYKLYNIGKEIFKGLYNLIKENQEPWNMETLFVKTADIDIHERMAKKISKQLKNIDTDYFTKEDLIKHFITRIDNYVDGKDYFKLKSPYNFLDNVGDLRLFITEIYGIARMFRIFTKDDRHKCDKVDSLSNIIYFGGNDHSTNLKYFLEQHFEVTALYKQSDSFMKRNDEYCVPWNSGCTSPTAKTEGDKIIITAQLKNGKIINFEIPNENIPNTPTPIKIITFAGMYYYTFKNLVNMNLDNYLDLKYFGDGYDPDKWNRLSSYANGATKYNRYIKLDTHVLQEFGWENIVNWNKAEYDDITSDEYIIE